MTLDPKALEAAARAIYENRHAGLRDVYDWEDSGLDDEHPGTRKRYMRDAESAITAYLAASSQWKPIKSAPKCVASAPGDNGRRPVIVCRSPFAGQHCPIVIARQTQTGWIHGKRGTRLWFVPTHWMPLPAPPEAP